MTTIRASLLAVVWAMAACTGDTGPAGPDGPTGPTGPQGPEGPLATPPVLTSLSPSWGSGNTQVTITGQNFSTTAADNQVYFDGYAATVLAATATELVVTAGVVSDEGATPMVVSVQVANQVSNGLFFSLVPTGTAGALDVPMPTAPTAVVEVGNELYIAAGSGGQGGGRSAGLYRMDSSGSVTRVFSADTLEVADGQGGTFTLIDGPLALASDGTDVYYTTTIGSVRRYQPATGEVAELLPAALGGNGPAFPARTGLTFDGAGVLYVVDRNIDQGGGDFGGVLWLDPADWSTGTITDALLAGTSTDGGIFGIATDGTDLFVTNEFWGEVYRVSDPTGAATVQLVADGAVAPRGIAIVDEISPAGPETIVVSDADGTLWFAFVDDAGAGLAAWGAPSGYAYQADGMAVNAAAELLLAQPQGSAVRSIPALGTDATIIAAGMRLALAAAGSGGTFYLATIGAALFGSGPPAQPDAALLEVSTSGASRVLYTAPILAGVVVSGADELTVSDCFGSRIFTLSLIDGQQADLLDSSDGVSCPAGLVRDGAGNLFYLDVDLGGTNPTEIGQRSAAAVHNPTFGTEFQGGAVFLALAGDTLLVSALGDPGQIGIEAVSATAGGVAEVLVPGATSGPVGLAGGPDGRAFALRLGTGAIMEIDPASGELLPYGSALAPGAVLGPGAGSFAFAAAFEADGTMVIPDFGQSGLVAVTP